MDLLDPLGVQLFKEKRVSQDPRDPMASLDLLVTLVSQVSRDRMDPAAMEDPQDPKVMWVFLGSLDPLENLVSLAFLEQWDPKGPKDPMETPDQLEKWVCQDQWDCKETMGVVVHQEKQPPLCCYWIPSPLLLG